MRMAWIGILTACSSPAPATDAPVMAPRCNASAAFGAPQPIAELNTPQDDVTARLTPDELTMVFARKNLAATYDLFMTTRASTTSPFAAPTLLASVNSVNSDVWPALSPDGLLLVFDSDRGTNMYRVHTTRRASTDAAFGTATADVALQTTDVQPYLANARALYFTSTRPEGAAGAHDLWRAEIDSTGATAAPTILVGGVNTSAEELAATVSPDELRIFFRRAIGGENDVYTATRASASDPFGVAVAVESLAKPGIAETPTWISPDGCVMYLFMNAPGGVGGEDLYVAARGM